MDIYALFVCIQLANSCQLMEPPRFTPAGLVQGRVYQTWGDCFAAGLTYAHHDPSETEVSTGRITASNGTWYECRTRHVDDWQAAR